MADMKSILIQIKNLNIKNLKIVKAIKNFFFHDLKFLIKNFNRHDGELSACALSFFALISFIPASLVIISILSYFYESERMVLYYLSKIKHELPPINIDNIVRIIDNIIYKKRYFAFIWVPFLFWWGSLVFDLIERVLEKAFRIKESHKYWKAKIRHFIIIISIGFLVVILIFLSNIIAIIQNSQVANLIEENLNQFQLFDWIFENIGNIPLFLSSFTGILVNSLLMFVIYRFVPPKKLDNLSIYKGALFASINYQIAKIVFSFYITEINDYTSIFGSLSTIVILMIWIWYSCFIFILGAEMAWIYYKRPG